MAIIINLIARNPLSAALALLAAILAGVITWQKFEAFGLEVRLGQARGTISELRGSIALHHAEAEALTTSLGEQTRQVRQWQAEAEKRREAANRAAARAEIEAASARDRIAEFEAAEGDSCIEAVNQVREIWPL